MNAKERGRNAARMFFLLLCGGVMGISVGSGISSLCLVILLSAAWITGMYWQEDVVG